MNVNTPETRQLAWIKKHHPKLYSFIARKRPDLIRDAETKTLNGMDGVDGWTDDLLNVVKQAVPVYQQQQLFTAQLKQASRAPTPAAATTVPATPVSLAPLAKSRGAVSMTVIETLIPVAGVAALVYFLFLRKPSRR